MHCILISPNTQWAPLHFSYWWGMDTQTQHHKTTQQFRQVMPYVSMCVCVPSRDGTACCGFDNVRRVDCVHLDYMISTFNASRSNNIQQPQQSDASTWPTCEWLLPSCQCRKACSPRRSARGPHNMQRGGAKVPSWSMILWLKNVNDSKYAGFYRIVLLAKPNSKDLQEPRASNYLIGSWHVILLGKLLQQTPTMAGRTQIIFPKAHQQTHTSLDEPRLAFKRVPLPLGGTYTLQIFLSLSLSFTWRAMVHEFSASCLFWLILLEHTILYHLLGVTPGQQLAAKSCQVWDMQLHSGDFLLVCTRNAEC